jgi:hypothetical protein
MMAVLGIREHQDIREVQEDMQSIEWIVVRGSDPVSKAAPTSSAQEKTVMLRLCMVNYV